MRLVANWRAVLRHSSSFWLNVLASFLSGAEIVVQVFLDDPPIPRGTFAILALATTLAAGVARFIAQNSVSGEKS
jgi:hypothetical protein